MAATQYVSWSSPFSCRRRVTAPVYNLHNDQVHGWVLTKGTGVLLGHSIAAKRADVHANPPSTSHTHLQPSSDTTAKDLQDKNWTSSSYAHVHFSLQNAKQWNRKLSVEVQLHTSLAMQNWITCLFVLFMYFIYLELWFMWLLVYLCVFIKSLLFIYCLWAFYQNSSEMKISPPGL